MLYKQLIELFDILDSATASGAQVVEYLRSIVPDAVALSKMSKSSISCLYNISITLLA